MNSRIKEVLDRLLERFRSGDIPEVVAMSMFPMSPDIPSARWSMLNRMIQFISGTSDGRGIRQWNQVNRNVVKGAKAFYILVPFFKRTKDADTGEEKDRLLGFMAKPVFRYEDTEGDPLNYPETRLPEDLPLIQKAEEWGISVKAVGGNPFCWGYYSGTTQEIGLATKEESVFFHELAHAGHQRIKGGLDGSQNPLEEITAELCATALCGLVGKKPDKTLGNSFRYIERYAGKMKLSPHSACLKVLGDAEKVLNLILEKPVTNCSA